MVSIPITNEQPGIAARVAWTGVGEVVPLGKLTVKKLKKAIEQVLTDDSYKKNALRLQKAIKQAGRVNRAVDIIEQAVSTGKTGFGFNKIRAFSATYIYARANGSIPRKTQVRSQLASNLRAHRNCISNTIPHDIYNLESKIKLEL